MSYGATNGRPTPALGPGLRRGGRGEDSGGGKDIQSGAGVILKDGGAGKQNNIV